MGETDLERRAPSEGRQVSREAPGQVYDRWRTEGRREGSADQPRSVGSSEEGQEGGGRIPESVAGL